MEAERVEFRQQLRLGLRTGAGPVTSPQPGCGGQREVRGRSEGGREGDL